ncbi:hypothetical protein SAMN05216298_0298 [Glycomyces sambucus]|uniref:Uncharacterized protein n=1 Tax=Glycomyces sambucus TaxID=380244 RepID=A0A1G9CF04_9ACTN|nr:hypothetical protein [Glycomyces sambucus]SDK50166.1 hypothetical protein SAMN05216298_0298 [Glycomyces sambucus]
MDVVAEFRSQMPLEEFPGVAHAWVSTEPNPFARLIYLARPDGQALFQVNVKPETDWDDVGAFVRFAQANMARLAFAAPMVAVPGLSLRHYRFDSAIAVLPAAADLAPTDIAHLDSRIYGLFPGWQCEVAGTESESLANRRYRREIRPSDWSRRPNPFLKLAYGFQRTNESPVEHSKPFSTDLDDAASTLRLIAEADTGWLSVTNWLGDTAALEYQRGKGLTWDGARLDLDAATDRIQAFTTEGR